MRLSCPILPEEIKMQNISKIFLTLTILTSSLSSLNSFTLSRLSTRVILGSSLTLTATVGTFVYYKYVYLKQKKTVAQLKKEVQKAQGELAVTKRALEKANQEKVAAQAAAKAAQDKASKEEASRIVAENKLKKSTNDEQIKVARDNAAKADAKIVSLENQLKAANARVASTEAQIKAITEKTIFAEKVAAQAKQAKVN